MSVSPLRRSQQDLDRLQSVRRSTKPVAIPLPETFSLSPALVAWAKGAGVERVRERFEHFVDVCAAKGYLYVDWPAAFRTACRKDWAGLGAPRQLVYCDVCAMAITGAWTQKGYGRVHSPGCES